MDPWLLTARLTLTRPVPADAGDVYRIHSDPRTYEHAPAARMTSRAQATDLVKSWIGHWAQHGFGYATVRPRGGPDVVGFAGLKHQHGALNLYYRFAPPAWGAGLATEVAAALVEWAALAHPRLAVVARTAVNNPRSQRVAERIGLVRQGPADETGHYLYRRGAMSE